MQIWFPMNKRKISFLAIGAVVILLNVFAWASTAFCDAYITWIFPIWVNTYGRLTGIFPFSVGEILLAAGGILVVIAVLLAVLLGVYGVIRCLCNGVQCVGKHKNRKEKEDIKKTVLWKAVKRFYVFFAWTVLVVSLIMTLNCSILYHGSTFSETYWGEASDGQYTLEELIRVRNMVVEECNRLSGEMERDENGYIVYEGDIKAAAIDAMQALGETYEQLNGYYPRPKPLYTSDFFSQQYICGYYFPFSMEANYNDVMYIMNKPATMCHELAHLRGFIFEDEANFISYLACIGSEDPFIVYSGYINVLNYLDNDFYRAIGRDTDRYLEQPRILKQVHEDNIFLLQEEWDRINGKALIETEVVDEVSDVLMDTTLKVNGVKDGIISYNRVVELLLMYYRNQG